MHEWARWFGEGCYLLKLLLLKIHFFSDNWDRRPHIVPESMRVNPSFTISQIGRLVSDDEEGVRPPAGDEPACLICLQNAATRMAVPCGHRQICRECLNALISTGTLYSNTNIPKPVTCAQCRALVSFFMRCY